ncbi:CYTH and CHAD domain-containing protein [Georgenia sp. EYE_87]|uniref:CYTH and CHAD domain-containing protein n=1 Tax=Georgenia sp. EYE_87 TaxID=2853448 RepID=UPI0020031ACF|nr:CYTH and CHAD domain-containing protein [Georgenia sp. EYE_87]MCK6211830.1 CYTH and CHAD domain-containing protein [Georgenia sp. EYE_87]
MHSQLEVERKFAVPEDFRLSDVAFPQDLREDGTLNLESTYVDTPDLRLAAHGVTLRRRTGGTDDGWHLKLPGPDGRLEVHEPPGPEGVDPPESLRRLVAVHVRDEPLVPVARLRTTRAVHRLRADGGPVLAEVVEDDVTAESLGDDVTVSTWREVEVELVDGGPGLLDEAAAALVAAGATDPPAPSKLARALGDRLPRPEPRPRPAGRGDPAGDVVRAYVVEQVAALKEADPGVRRDAEDAVHQMRVASRRLRSALKTFRPVLDRARTDVVRGELRWLAHALGDARDTEVLRARLREMLDRDGHEPDRDAAAARVDTELGTRYDRAHREVLSDLDSPRYFRLLDELDALVAAPPLTEAAGRPAREVLPRTARKAYRELRRLHHRAREAESAEEHETLLHEVRKAAKRARYAGEALRPAFGRDAKRFAAAMEEVQEVLGEHRDSVIAGQTVTGLAAQARDDGEDTFELGRLAGLEEARSAAAAEAYDAAWAAASRRKLRRWTRR